MALVLGVQNVSKAYGAAPLFRDVAFGIHDGDRIGLVGPNGTGKSTFLRILAGLEPPDSGTVALRRLTRVGVVPQHPDLPPDQSIAAIVAAAAANGDVDDLERERRVQTTLSRCGFPDTAALAGALSGGWQKRVAIAQALVLEPDLLLMDEPTNHLDLDGILWLERLLVSETAACLLVSHDRWFLEHVATRMVDLDPIHARGLFETDGPYSTFLERKAAALAEQARNEATLANRVRREVDWLRRGPKARTSKSQARIDEAGRLIDELAATKARHDQRTAAVAFDATERRTRRLLVAEGLGKRFGDRWVLDGIDFVLGPGARLGLLGANGTGKSTVIGLIAGTLTPDRGTITRADGLRVAVLDQHRTAIDPNLSLARALAPEGDQVVFAGRPIHVAGWARRFLFRTEQLPMPIGRLSGGERARVQLARLMLEPADILVLDEPTNDLDIPTLDVLEEALVEFPGAVVLVTHDRYLFEKVTTTVLAFDGSGRARAFADYAQWEQARREPRREPTTKPAPPAPRPSTKRLSWSEQREWAGMEAAILAAEAALADRQTDAADPAIAADATELAARCRALEAAQTEVDRLYARWAELEAKGGMLRA